MSEHGDEEAPAADEGPKQVRNMHLPVLDRFVMPVVIALVAFAASFAAATIANDGAARNQDALFQEERVNDARERRSTIYTAYLDAVGAFAPMFHQSTDCYQRTADEDTFHLFPGACRGGLPAEYRATVDRLTLAIGKVRVYGTKNVYSAARELHRILLALENSDIVGVVGKEAMGSSIPAPQSQDPRVKGLGESGRSVRGIAATLERNYNSSYEAYIVAMCDELSTDPANC